MYSANQGFGGTQNYNAQQHQQQHQQQQQMQQQMQQGQQAMYNPQQQQPQQQQQQMQQQQHPQYQGLPQGAPGGGFLQGGNPQMMSAGVAGMMQNPMLQQMAANGQLPGFPQQFSPQYAQNMPNAMNMQGFSPNNYMMGTGNMQGYPMNQSGMTQQQMLHRMQQQQQQQQQQPQQQQQQQPQQQHQQHQQQQQQQQQPQQQRQHPQQPHPQNAIGQASTPQRPPSSAQGTPTGPTPQAQFPTPQPMPQTQTQALNHLQQPPTGASAPQTPTHPGVNGAQINGGQSTTAQSPTTEPRDPRDKERLALLLDINHELLYESIQIQKTQEDIKREQAGTDASGERKATDEETMFQQDYLQCMRRLQANLTYMAALVDRKTQAKLPPCPAYLSPPPLHLSLRPRAQPPSADGTTLNLDLVADREERNRAMKELYLMLQAAYPGFDPKKEPVYRIPQTAGQKMAGGPGTAGAGRMT